MKLGIDLGTTNTLASYLNDNNTPELIPDPRFEDIYITPSSIHVAGNTYLVGEALERVAIANSQLQVTRNAKLSMGKATQLFKDTNGKNWKAELVAAAILKKMKQDAEVAKSTVFDSALIAIPANFDSAQRMATQAAASMAGFKQIDLVEEPVAAAASYCFNSDKTEQTIFVYDLGGGTFDATVIHSSSDGLYTLSTIGSVSIGGKFFDELIIDELKNLYKAKFQTLKLSNGAIAQFRKFAEYVKTTLTPKENTFVSRSLLVDGNVMDVCFTYTHLNKLIHSHLKETMNLSEQCVKEAGLSWDQIDTILLVGGSSQLPAVKASLSKLSNKNVRELELYQPHEAIAYGAAILANEAHTESGAVIKLKQSIASNNLGLRTLNPKTGQSEVEVLIERNTPLPKTVTKTFYTNRIQQENMAIELLQAKQVDDEFESLGNFNVGPFENDQEHMPIEIEITYGRDGVVRVRAFGLASGKAVVGVVKQGGSINVSSLDFLSDLNCV
mgnify:CR=1 FL=1